MASSSAISPCTFVWRFTPCCGGPAISFCSKKSAPAGIYRYIADIPGTPINGYGGSIEDGFCYTVVTEVGGVAVYPSFPNDQVNNVFDYPTSTCEGDCNPCPKKIVFTPCCGGQSVQFLDDANYIGLSTTIPNQYIGANLIFDGYGQVLIPDGCYLIDRVNASTQDLDTLTAAPDISNINSAGGTSCETATVECAPCGYFYQITNCADENETYCTSSNLQPYINNQIENPLQWPVVQVAEYPNKCFYVEQIVTCTNPVTVTVTRDVLSCAKCQESIIIYYQLINCNNPQFIVYTSDDLLVYVGHYIKLDQYGSDCFYVQVLDSLSGGDTPVTPTGDPFETCEECTLPRYKLVDCQGEESDIITNTDLSDYVGSVITLQTCPDICWEVYEENVLSSLGPVYFKEEFAGCTPCLDSLLLCKCQSALNDTGVPVIGLRYIGCDGIEASTEALAPGERSTKYCVKRFLTGGDIRDYGNCTENTNTQTWECVEVKQPKRKVTPGYDTPACTPEYYENVECHFSEWMYKDVLQKRYGISNCCPDELMKWEIKHELLMLDALINPDYQCPTSNSCCDPAPVSCTSCGCSTCNC